MRLSPSLLGFALVLAPVALAQAPPQPGQAIGPSAVFALPDGPLTLEQVQRLPPDARLMVVTPDGVAGPRNAEDVLKLLREGKEVRSLRSTQRVGCEPPEYAEIRAEQTASNEKLLKMQRRGEIIPLQHQYEQELYYRERFAMVREAKCGKTPTPDPEVGAWVPQPPMPDMTLKACRAIAPDCQPRKHW
jgi:hypothetical protein